MKLFRRVSCPKVLLWLSNLTLLGCACALIVAGGVLYVDQRKLLVSKLLGVTNEFLAESPKPLFYWIAIGCAGCGLIGLFAAILGCWANCWTNYCTLTLYFLVVFTLLIAEFVLIISITVWPNCLGLNLEEDAMVRALTGQYGIPGHEQFTSAIDLVQTQFHCCGISSDINYDTSYWQLQEYSRKDLVVPLTCCVLDNSADEEHAYLDPRPSNLTLCQSLQRTDYSKARHLRSCLEELQLWYHRQYLIFLGMCAAVTVVNFFVLLSILFSCTHLKRQRQGSIDRHIAEFERKVNDRRKIVTMATRSPSSFSYSTRSSPIPDDGRSSMPPPPPQPVSDYQQSSSKQRRTSNNNLSTFRATTNSANRIDYRGGTKAYLV